MPEFDPSASNPPDPSPKQPTKRRSISSETPSTSARPRSPTSLDAPSTADGVKIPTKRARKAINCGPCRLSKLKCDRERPCSSCRLRGTTASCYQVQDAGSPTIIRTDDYNDLRSVNTTVEFSKIRQALNLVEAHVNYIQRSPASFVPIPPSQPSFDAHGGVSPINCSPLSQLKQDLAKSDLSEQGAAPGARGQSNRRGLYAGSTSAASHLTLGISDGGGGTEFATVPTERTHDSDISPTHNGDYDLRKQLPHASVIDGFVDFYFEYCNWVFRHVNFPSFIVAWARYKSGGTDRVVLATVCMIMAVTLHYLPAGHELLRALPSDTEELGTHFYNIMRLALQRRQAESHAYTLELVELLLIRTHYLTLSKIDSEETWHVKGELVNIATAMGLHRDPGKEMPLEVAERRRWAWWHVILLERWQAFMFGRPISIASHHFDTQLPSYCDPEVDPSGRLYDANIHLFRLASILGDIMDDAVSLRPVPYERVLAKDRILQEWWDTLPMELDIDDYSLVSFLASSITSKRRIGVQSVNVRTTFLHIRFTMHRPYASLAHDETSKYATSLELAVNAADNLIALTAHARPEMLSHAALAVPGHMTSGPLHCFSAAMFFCFQIINNPEQPGVRLHRANVLRAIKTLESCRGMHLAVKALDILRALGPLYTEAFLSDTPSAREHKKQAILPSVRKLQFPYVDSPIVQIGTVELSGTRNGTLSPAQSSSHAESPRLGLGPAVTQPPHPSVQGTAVHAQETEVLSMPSSVLPAPMLPPRQPHLLPQQHQQHAQHATCENIPSPKWPHANLALDDAAQYLGQQQQQGHPALAQQRQYQTAEEQEAMWRTAHHAPAATMVPPESTAASSSPRTIYAPQMIQQQDAYPQGGGASASASSPNGRMGVGVGAEGVLWGATSGFVQGEWDRMYPGLGCRLPHEG